MKYFAGERKKRMEKAVYLTRVASCIVKRDQVLDLAASKFSFSYLFVSTAVALDK